MEELLERVHEVRALAVLLLLSVDAPGPVALGEIRTRSRSATRMVRLGHSPLLGKLQR